jgi:hypothetical protein
MSANEMDNWERRETIEELLDIARLAEEMAQRLVLETHGKLYNDAVEFRALLHQARVKAELIKSMSNAINRA